MIAFQSYGRSFAANRLASQKIQELADGGPELTLQLSSLHEIAPWVHSWGEHVRVSRPAELKKKVLSRLEAALA